MLKSNFAIRVGGIDVTSGWNPHLVSIEVQDKSGEQGDSARFEFADVDGVLGMPDKGAPVDVTLDGVEVFRGVADEPRSRGSRGGGRRLLVSAKSFDSDGPVKQPSRDALADASLEDWLKRLGQRAGVDQIFVAPAFASIRRAWWGAEGRSFIDVATGLAGDLGAVFKIARDRAVFAERGVGRTPSGRAMPPVNAVVGVNVTAWDIAPTLGRERWQRERIRFFDRSTGRWRDETVDVQGSGAGNRRASGEATRSAPDRDAARRGANGRRVKDEEEEGGGSVEMVLNAQARAQCPFTLTGARPGVDGTYVVDSVTHRVDRSSGSTTSVEIKTPSAGTGRDARPRR
jgi:uncharacterized protein